VNFFSVASLRIGCVHRALYLNCMTSTYLLTKCLYRRLGAAAFWCRGSTEV